MRLNIFKKSTWMSRRQRMRRWIALAAVSVVALIILVWGGITLWYQINVGAKEATARDIVVKIEPGMSANEIANLLENQGIIRSSTAFSWYLDRNGVRDSLQAGTYRLSPSYTVSEIVDIVANGRVDVRLVTILPGLRLDEIKQTLVDEGFDENEVVEALNASYEHPLFATKPPEATLEGYIFPESYQVDGETTVKGLLTKSFDQFYSELDGNVMGGIEKQGLTLHQAITLASIVQMEVPDYDTQRQVSQVFLKRLAMGIPLGADPTFRYAAAINGVEESVSIDSPYNTRLYAGLPPGPIANFNISALKAVANPAGTDYLFFVAGDDGITRFSNTEEEHNALKEQYCIELCRL